MDDFLVKILAHIDLQHSIVEENCSILRKLLKPWPNEKRPDQEDPTQVVSKQSDHERKEENNDLTPDEKQALECVDRLIGKAQRALKIKDKLKISERSSSPDSECNKSNGGKKDDSSTMDDKHHDGPKVLEDVVDTHHSRLNGMPSREKAVTNKKSISSSNKNQLQKSYQTVPSAETKSRQNNASNLSSRNTTPRPSSVTSHSRPTSSKSRYTPAHVNAPFKTDTSTKVPHRRLNHIHKNHLNKPQKKTGPPPQKKQPFLSNGLKTLPKISNTTKENEACLKTNLEEEEIKADNDVRDKELERACLPESSDPFVQASTNVQVAGVMSKQAGSVEKDKLNGPNKPQDPILDNTVSSLGTESKFSLKHKCSKIKIPPKLSKLIAENHALSEKCSTTKMVKKLPDADLAENFVERLCMQNGVSEELWARAKAMSCLQGHKLMLESLHSLNIEELSETSPPEAVHRAKRLLEFILSVFAQTQDEADYFTKVQFRHPLSHGKISAIQPCDDDLVKSLFSPQEQDHSGTDDFVMHALESSQLWKRLKFEKDLHQLHLHLLSLTEAEWWDVLVNDPENSSVLQLVHSLLTSGGEFFPAIVKNPYS